MFHEAELTQNDNECSFSSFVLFCFGLVVFVAAAAAAAAIASNKNE